MSFKKYVVISGFSLKQSNRGNAALSYGSVSFLEQKGLLQEGQELLNYHCYLNIWKSNNRRIQTQIICINGKKWVHHEVPIFYLEKLLVSILGIIIPFTLFGKTIRQVALEAADYGGDGFSDIYGDRDFINRMNQTFLLWHFNIPLIMLPQTIGPFKKKRTYKLAVKILNYAKKIYVRDNKFEDEFQQLGLSYSLSKDLSSYMLPEPWDIVIGHNPIGINVSGLAYCNSFNGLENQFSSYPKLIDEIINHFIEKGCTVYLIPHSYNYQNPDNNDDMVACRLAYHRLIDKSKVILVDKDMTSPQIKYLISQMHFFIGARMHANFAAIYTNVPVFGTAYSYKFEGAFNANGLNGTEQTAMINNLSSSDISSYINKIDKYYNKATNHKNE